jgi:hypothetical protein
MLRWVQRVPEEFVAAPRSGNTGVSLPSAHRPLWDLERLSSTLHEAIDERAAAGS